ncbi:MAG TPA: response regulator transcription factor [Puia sp.]|jgi:DNA-binding NarL/FixJ family response regulator|nr:response regulator transcription factor [Puia sp.]
MDKEKKIILIVDDSVIVIDRLVNMLEELTTRHTIFTCNSYQEAINAIIEKNIDIAVLDINLPDGNGINILRYLKKNKPAVQVIMLTNQSTEFYRKLCLKEGAAYFIDKSSGFDALPEIISSLLN